ncbi:hypothetical protein AAFC00_005979 [Neodothiora populina]|uniref:Asteroid domain-containing protein n=1 Tax=Neodothiora populina TaxID=2781224 RepID=A0ABR3P6J6_9PEZI
MGIPHLAHHLQPHGTKVLLPRATKPPEQQTSVIIDGPSLAYHCYHFCLAKHSNAHNSYEALPSYKELGEAAVSWLDQIEQFGLKVEQVFFDGLLPASKNPVRLSRLQNYANQLVTFRASNKEDLPARVKSTRPSKHDLLSTATVSARLKALPAVPFLVPAVMEAIASSHFKDVTRTIPGEADAYCAEAARESGGIIFTSDSDLLVHDLGQDGKVILFRDVEIIHLPSKGPCLKAQQYQPSVIAQAFDLPNLVAMAFFMSEGHCSLREAIKSAKEKNPVSAEFTEFKEQYASLPVLSTLAAEYLTRSDREAFRLLSQLDPRVSELMHQISMKDESSSPPQPKSLNMYLPFLLDDPTRTSAWRAGAEIRIAAYSLLRLLDVNISSINEYERKGTRISDTVATLLLPNELSTAMQTHITNALQPQSSAALITPKSWRALSAKVICSSNVSNGKPPPSLTDLTRLILGDGNTTEETPLTWSYIHASAQLDAVLYSFRMFLQIARLVVAFVKDETMKSDAVRAESTPSSSSFRMQDLESAIELLSSLPRLAELASDDNDVAVQDTREVRDSAAQMLRSLGVHEENYGDEGDGRGGKKKKKRKKKAEHVPATSPPAWRRNNMFGSLE